MIKTGTEPTYHVFFDPSQQAVVMEWNGYATSDQFREGTELMLNELIRNKASKVLANVKKMILIGSEDQKWLEEFFIPRASQFGFKAIALVKPDSYFNQVAIEAITKKINKEQINVGFFDTVEEASAWLGNK